jgi:hypothetical protein
VVTDIKKTYLLRLNYDSADLLCLQYCRDLSHALGPLSGQV